MFRQVEPFPVCQAVIIVAAVFECELPMVVDAFQYGGQQLY